MNKLPLNIIIAGAVASLLWVVTAFIFGGMFEDYIFLSQTTFAEWLNVFQMVLLGAVIAGFLCTFIWFYYGSRKSTVTQITAARKNWNIIFLILIIAAFGLFLFESLPYMQQGIDWLVLLIVFLIISLDTYIYFFVMSLFFSPLAVKYVVLGRRK